MKKFLLFFIFIALCMLCSCENTVDEGISEMQSVGCLYSNDWFSIILPDDNWIEEKTGYGIVYYAPDVNQTGTNIVYSTTDWNDIVLDYSVYEWQILYDDQYYGIAYAHVESVEKTMIGNNSCVKVCATVQGTNELFMITYNILAPDGIIYELTCATLDKNSLYTVYDASMKTFQYNN